MDRANEDVGLFISETLNTLGFGVGMVEFRKQTHYGVKSYFDHALRDSGLEIVTGESLSDVSFLKKNVVCFSCSDTSFSCQGNVISFESETRWAPPGCTRLVLVNNLSSLAKDEDILTSISGMEKYLGSTLYFNKMKYKIGRSITVRQIVGPSMCTEKTSFNFPLRYAGGEVARQLRRKLWPVDCQALEVSHMEGLVYPDFSSDSEYSHLEWRISYASAEQLLFHSLNITQVKLYILLQMIAKSILQPISSDINPYVMKNIVFWLIHIYPRDIFQERYLIILLLTALGMLYNCVKSDFIPCYVIENRNLLSGVMDVPRKHELLEMLSVLQEEKARMLLRCEKLRCIMLMKFKSPHIIDIYQRQRDRLELMLLILSFIQAKYAASAHTSKDFKALIIADEYWLRVATAVYDIVFPGWEEQYSRGLNVPDIVVSRIQEILS